METKNEQFAIIFRLFSRRGHPKQFQTTGADTINLAAKKPKKRTWKVKVLPEVDEDDEEEYKEIVYVKPVFDCEKIYQLIEETVDKIFLATPGEGEEAEPQPYVSYFLRFYFGIQAIQVFFN